MLKVITIVGTRPELIRLSSVIKRLDRVCDHTLVHTGQNFDYELNQIFYDDLNLRAPDDYLDCARETVADTESDQVFERLQPDALLILGDTNSAMAAIPAKRRKIPIFHMEAGNRCFDMRVPEEINRKIVDHIADINLPYSTIARDYLLREGIRPDTVIKTGSPMREVLKVNEDKIEQSAILTELGLANGAYFLVSAHRQENVDDDENFLKFIDLLDRLAADFQLPVVVSTHPRTRIRLGEITREFNSLIRFLKPFSFSDYVHLQLHAKVVLSDSGTITEESSILKFPALNIREVHERPEGMEAAAVMLTGMEYQSVYHAISVLETQDSAFSVEDIPDYGTDNVSEKVVKIIASYTEFVNREIWRK